MDFHVDLQSFALTGSFAPHAVHFRNKTRSSRISLVSGLPHSLQTTKSFAYCCIFGFTEEEEIFLPNTNLGPSMVAGVASSRCRYFNKCSASRCNAETI